MPAESQPQTLENDTRFINIEKGDENTFGQKQLQRARHPEDTPRFWGKFLSTVSSLECK